jgi:hypothetical protein
MTNAERDSMDPEVTSFIEAIEQPWQVEIANNLRSTVHRVVPDVQERIQYKKPHFLKNGHYAAVLHPAKAYVAFMIFNTQDLDIPDGLFEKGGPAERKTVKVKEGQQVDYDRLGSVLAQAVSTL